MGPLGRRQGSERSAFYLCRQSGLCSQSPRARRAGTQIIVPSGQCDPVAFTKSTEDGEDLATGQSLRK